MKALKFVAVIFVLLSVVIGLVIASYDPVEQAKKGQDEKLQQDAGEFIQAAVQYYSVKNGLPWFTTDENGINCNPDGQTVDTLPLSQLKECLDALVLDSTLRKDAISAIAAKKLFVTNPSTKTNNSLDSVVCFQPQSKHWQNDPNTRFNQDGTDAPSNRCYAQGGMEFCYWCTQ